jgi:hypothetical protein
MQGGKPPGKIVLAITALLEEHPEGLTRAEIFAALQEQGITSVSDSITRMSKKNTWGPKRLYIIRWVRECSACTRRRRKPVYALGDKPNAKPIKLITPAESCRTWKQHEKMHVNSVWQFGMGAEARRRERKKLPATDAPIVKTRRKEAP